MTTEPHPTARSAPGGTTTGTAATGTAATPGAATGPARDALPDAPTQAAHLNRARTAQARVLLEDYVELIADLAGDATDAAPIGPSMLARHLGVSHATVIKCIARLGREGLATALPYRGVVLTAQGLALANKVRRRHRLVVALLRAVGVPDADAAADAEGIEHHVSDGTLQAFERFLAGDNGRRASLPDRFPVRD